MPFPSLDPGRSGAVAGGRGEGGVLAESSQEGLQQPVEGEAGNAGPTWHIYPEEIRLR